MTINTYEHIAEAVCRLFSPLVEVVLHDLKTNTITGIYNPFSGRSIGDESLLNIEVQPSQWPDIFEPYEKIDSDGKKLKSISITLRDERSRPIGLMCINFDTSRFEEIKQFLELFCKNTAKEKPPLLFKEDWKDKIHTYIHSYTLSLNKNISSLSKREKIDLIHKLEAEGAFEAKNAAVYIGSLLDISRATVYNYLTKKNV